MKTIWLFSIIVVAAAVVAVSVILVKRANVPSTGKNQSTVSSSAVSGSASSQSNNQKVVGEYWCRSYNYNGAGGSCSLQSKLILNADGSYTFSKSSGHYTFSSDKITFDGDMAKRGPATYTAEQQIRWEFSENGAPYTITYYFRQAVQ